MHGSRSEPFVKVSFASMEVPRHLGMVSQYEFTTDKGGLFMGFDSFVLIIVWIPHFLKDQ